MNQAAERGASECPRQPWSQQVAAVAQEMGAGMLESVMETLLRQVGRALPLYKPLPKTPSLMGLPEAEPCLSHELCQQQDPEFLPLASAWGLAVAVHTEGLSQQAGQRMQAGVST